MTETDVFYRAFGELLKALDKDGGISRTISAAAKAPNPARLTVCHNVCNVEDDWISAIERGLVFIGKVIDEDRQFIRSEGEIQPIEKVKRISRESVQHLSRHSDFITRKQKDEIVPDKLYTVERDSDYAVYENRFVYLLLCTIRDFVAVRYEAINAAYREYRGDFEVKKKIALAARRLQYELKLHDEQDDALSAPADRRCAEALKRMEQILESVAFYLRTPLMEEVSRSDKISGNITKTNVLMMNKNFHEALLLYEFLIGYEADGYTVEKVYDTFDPLSNENMRDITAAVMLANFLVYEHGLGLEEYFEARFREEEERRKEEAQAELVRKIKQLKKKIESSGKGVEEYMLALEERIKELEKNTALLAATRAENEQLKAQVARLEEERKTLLADIEGLKKQVGELRAEIERAEEEHKREIERLRAEYEAKCEELKKQHGEEIAEIKRQTEEKLSELKEKHEEEVARLKEGHSAEIAALHNSYGERMKVLEEKKQSDIARIKAGYEAKLADEAAKLKAGAEERGKTEAELSSVKAKLEQSEKTREIVQARLLAVRREFGLLTEADDFTTEEGFNALEHEFEVLGRLVREEWTDVKKILKKEFYSGIHDTMRRKRGKKSREYEELCAQISDGKKPLDGDGENQ